MLPYLTTAVALVALLCSLYKEILAAAKAAKIQPVIRAIRLHHVAQFAVVMLALWAGIDADSKAKKIRLAQLDAAAAQAASQHSIPILDYYFLKLLPAASLLKNHDEYQEALDTMPTALQERNAWERVATPRLIQEHDAALEAFSGLQRIARSVLAESTMYGQRYPLKLVEWASRTLEIKAHDLPILLGTGEDGSAYAELTGLGIGSSITAARDAMTRLEK
ncbi:hypothetical protein SAMN04488135_10412 [Pollutimonas bauzanensis]|uniref:Uncharacterized protein n=1 Tax=Pollutimonas bauzanensis TaxID=658167 RepID=A0A1M5UIW0_9BURK|nr:hypothetical protein SAMN04488135_10412 [Pollutimonas bauzanensis]